MLPWNGTSGTLQWKNRFRIVIEYAYNLNLESIFSMSMTFQKRTVELTGNIFLEYHSILKRARENWHTRTQVESKGATIGLLICLLFPGCFISRVIMAFEMQKKCTKERSGKLLAIQSSVSGKQIFKKVFALGSALLHTSECYHYSNRKILCERSPIF